MRLKDRDKENSSRKAEENSSAVLGDLARSTRCTFYHRRRLDSEKAALCVLRKRSLFHLSLRFPNFRSPLCVRRSSIIYAARRLNFIAVYVTPRYKSEYAEFTFSVTVTSVTFEWARRIVGRNRLNGYQARLIIYYLCKKL